MVGWGTTSEDGDTSGVLREAHLDVLPPKSCLEAYKADFNPSEMICAGRPEGGADACQVKNSEKREGGNKWKKEEISE